MKWLQTALPFLRDVIAIGTAALIAWVSLALWALGIREPDKLLLGFAGGILIPAAVAHTRHLLSAGPSSPSSPSPSLSSPPASPPGADHEH